MADTYVAVGSVRGSCDHAHRSIATAVACADRDRTHCRNLGGGAYSDRGVARCDGEEMSSEEIDAVDDCFVALADGSV